MQTQKKEPCSVVCQSRGSVAFEVGLWRSARFLTFRATAKRVTNVTRFADDKVCRLNGSSFGGQSLAGFTLRN